MNNLTTEIRKAHDLLHQNIYAYYSRKFIVFLSEWLAYLLAIGFFALIFVADFHTDSWLSITIKVLEKAEIGTEAIDKYHKMVLVVKLIFVFAAIVLFILGLRLRADRIFRTKTKKAERLLNDIVKHQNSLMNELN